MIFDRQTLPATSYPVICGCALYAGSTIDAKILQQHLELCSSFSELTDFCKKLDGFFAIAAFWHGQVLIIADRIRSIPLFYTATGSVSLSANELDSPMLEPLACAQFTELGYTTGSSTLFHSVYQLQAAEWVCLGAGQITQQRYAAFLPQVAVPALDVEQNFVHWHQELDRLMAALARQCLELFNGRQLVVPLSGGYDSRALLVALVRAGASDLLCFTFGRRGSREMYKASQVAEALGVRWIPVYYNASTWRRVRTASWFDDYLIYAANGVSCPTVQVLPAVMKLKASGDIKPTAVLLPAHTGDFLSGGHLPPLANDATLEQLANFLWNKHFRLWHLNPEGEKLRSCLELQLACIKNHMPDVTAIQLAEYWNWQERQSKFIVNSNRYYESLQLDWWMPLWQHGAMQFWQEVPQSLRRNCLLWRSWIDKSMLEVSGQPIVGNADAEFAGLKLKISRALDYFMHPNLLLHTVPFYRWALYRLRLGNKPGTLYGYLAERTLKLIKSRFKLRENP